MKKLLFLLLLITSLGSTLFAQEKYGKTLNIGLGAGGYSGYYGYVNQTLPVIQLNYEFDVAKNFTLAPFLSYYSYSREYYYGNPSKGYKFYGFHETVVPIGLKGSYYFDSFLKASSHWDFYLGASIGFAFRRVTWDADYYGDRNYYNSGNPMFLDVHIGTEYHFNNKVGAYLDLSNGVSTLGLAFHIK